MGLNSRFWWFVEDFYSGCWTSEESRVRLLLDCWTPTRAVEDAAVIKGFESLVVNLFWLVPLAKAFVSSPFYVTTSSLKLSLLCTLFSSGSSSYWSWSVRYTICSGVAGLSGVASISDGETAVLVEFCFAPSSAELAARVLLVGGWVMKV